MQQFFRKPNWKRKLQKNQLFFDYDEFLIMQKYKSLKNC